MARGGKFKLNRRTVRTILREDDNLADAVNEVAEDMLGEAGPNATIDRYRTDRQVSGIVVPADEQARDGAATRAAQNVASRRGKPFRSRAEWRRAHKLNRASAQARADVSPRYSSLPERSRRVS